MSIAFLGGLLAIQAGCEGLFYDLDQERYGSGGGGGNLIEIEGFVTLDGTNEALTGVRVCSGEGESAVTAVTNSNGRFVLSVDGPPPIDVRASQSGFFREEKEVDNWDATLNFELTACGLCPNQPISPCPAP